MPLYQYLCPSCGVFEEWHSMTEAREAYPCISCGDSSRRVYSSVGLALIPKALCSRIEQSAVPKLVSKSSSCGHSHHGASHSHSHGGSRNKQGRSAPSRPWQISH